LRYTINPRSFFLTKPIFMIRTLFILLTALSLTLFMSCETLDQFTQFDLDYTSKVTIPASTVVNLPVTLPTPPITTNVEERLENNSTREDLIEAIFLEEMNLEVVAPVGQSLDFLEEVTFLIRTDSLPEIELASATLPDTVGSTFALTPTDVDLQAYLKQNEIQLTTRIVTRKLVAQETDLEIYTRFLVDAKILGL